MAERLLTVRDVASVLGVSEKEVLDLAEKGEIPAYKIGGVYLRFKPEQIEDFKKKADMTHLRKDNVSGQSSFKDSIRDFLYFNDFYIIATLIILLILFVILRG